MNGYREELIGSAAPVVVVTRDGYPWRVEIADLDLAHRTAPLTRVDTWVRDVLNLNRLDWVNYEFRTGDQWLDRLVRKARDTRRAAQLAHEHARATTIRLLAETVGYANLSIRDRAVLLGLSHQRVQQLSGLAERDKRDPA